ncbi:Hemopexin-like domain containing protein [Rhypophila sp. PSN 637]
MSTRAAFESPAINEAYFFSGSRYARIQYSPGTPDEKITYGPTTIAAEWKTLEKAGFASSGIDAAMAIRDSPGHENQVYFFSGTKYLRIRFTPGTPDEELLNGPTEISSGWASLDKAGFKTVDAILPITGVESAKGEAYVFSGDQYVRVKVNPGVHRGDTIVFGPANIADEWPNLAKAGFGDGVDAVLSASGQKGFEDEAYFFKGQRYVRVRVIPGQKQETITYGPADIKDGWKTLAWGW